VPPTAKFVKLWVTALAPGEALDIQLRGTVPADASLDAELNNCLVFSADGLAPQAS